MMRRFLRKYLWQQPTLFSWLLLLVAGTFIVYATLIIRDSFINAEALMGFLILPWFVSIAALILLTDYYTRRYLQNRTLLLWLLQLVLVLPLVFVVWHKFFYRTVLYTQAEIKWILLVHSNRPQENPHRNFLLQQTFIYLPDDGIVLLQSPLSNNERQHLEVRNKQGEKEKYVIQYGTGSYSSGLHCNNKQYNTEILLIEHASGKVSPLTDSVLHTLYNKACEKINSSQ